jgi:hypothetical protein
MRILIVILVPLAACSLSVSVLLLIAVYDRPLQILQTPEWPTWRTS